MRWFVVGVAVLGIASASLIGAPANAGVNGLSSHYEAGHGCANNLLGRARFQHVPDDMIAYDDCVDGWGANGELLLQNGAHQFCRNNGGGGTSLPCPFNFAEGVAGWIMAFSDNGGVFQGSGDPAPLVT